jgi:hypothetical protein
MATTGLEGAPTQDTAAVPSPPNPEFCTEVFKPGQPRPDFKRIHSGKENVDLLLNSAFVESTGATYKGNKLAQQDFQAAINTADKFDPKWISAQLTALDKDTSTTGCTYWQLADLFRAGVDRLEPSTRREVNVLTYKIHDNFTKQGTSAWNTSQPELTRLMKLLPEDLQSIYKQFPALDRHNDQISTAISEVTALQQAPLRTRALSARFEAVLKHDDRSRELLQQMAKIDPGLNDSEAFQQSLKTPETLAETTWAGENGDPPPQPDSAEDKLMHMFEGLLNGGPDGDRLDHKESNKSGI